MRFRYQLYDIRGCLAGQLLLPTFIPVPRNGWAADVVPEALKDHVKIIWGDRSLHVEYDLLSDRAVRPNDLKFSLVEGNATLATATVCVGRRPTWTIDCDVGQILLILQARFFGHRFAAYSDAVQIGRIQETTGFSLWRRKFEIALPDAVDPALQAFLFFLCVNAWFR